MVEEHNALEYQRLKQQGLGRPIISVDSNGYRRVFVGNKSFLGKWKTFHDFLMEYIKIIFDRDWGNAEIKKPYEERHPLLKLYDKICKYEQQILKNPGAVHTAPMNGSVEAFLRLSYNLYLISHNIGLQTRLIKRLKTPMQFLNHCYETFVASIFIRAGFGIIFEDEDDASSTHCEFIAIHKESGEKYFVEAKFRTRKSHLSPTGTASLKLDLGVKRLIRDALKKTTDYKRIIFIDINLPHSIASKYTYKDFSNLIRTLEEEQKTQTNPLQAYIFLTNSSYYHDLDSFEYRKMLVAEGFNIPDFGLIETTTLHEALLSRKRHKPIHKLCKFLEQDLGAEIPSTFDGEIPLFAYDKNRSRLIIGHKYFVPDYDGNYVEVELLNAVVVEQNKIATGICRTIDDKTILYHFPLTDDEIATYRAHPDTFFGKFKRQSKGLKNPIDMYYFLYEGFKNLPREEILKRLDKHPEYNKLQNESQEELLSIYCENIVNNNWKQ